MALAICYLKSISATTSYFKEQTSSFADMSSADNAVLLYYAIADLKGFFEFSESSSFSSESRFASAASGLSGSFGSDVSDSSFA